VAQAEFSNETLVEGLRGIKRASPPMAMLTALATFVFIDLLINEKPALSSSLSILVPGILFFYIYVVGVYLMPSVAKFAEWNSQWFNTPKTLMKIGYFYGGLILFIGAILMIAGVKTYNPNSLIDSPASSLMILGYLLVNIGEIVVIIGLAGFIRFLYRLWKTFKSKIILASFIITIISAGLLQFAAWILLYIGARSLERKIRTDEVRV